MNILKMCHQIAINHSEIGLIFATELLELINRGIKPKPTLPSVIFGVGVFGIEIETKEGPERGQVTTLLPSWVLQIGFL